MEERLVMYGTEARDKKAVIAHSEDRRPGCVPSLTVHMNAFLSLTSVPCRLQRVDAFLPHQNVQLLFKLSIIGRI